MDWKEFFKPTKGKLLIAFIIVLLWPNYVAKNMGCWDPDFIYIDENGNTQVNEELAAQAGCHEVFLDVYFFDLILGIGGDPFLKLFHNAMNFILSVIVSYSVGCTAIYGFSRLKKKT